MANNCNICLDDNKTILLVEDEAVTSLATSRVVEKFGYRVITAASGDAAVETALSDTRISLILMDIDLGDGIDGTEAARRILAEKKIPIVFLTSHSEKEYVDKVKEITRYGYVIKNSGNFVLQSSIEMAFELFDAHNATKRNEYRLNRAEVTAEFGSWEFDLVSKTVTASEGAKALYGLDGAEWNLSDIQKVPVPEYRPLLDEALRDLVQKGIPYDLEFEIIRKTDNKLLTIHSIAHYNAEEKLIYGIIHDITRSRHYEHLLEKKNRELAAVNQDLAATNEEFETSNEELMASNTELMEIQNEVIAKEYEYQSLMDSMINAFALFESVFDAYGVFTSYRFKYINRAYEEITGVKYGDVLGRTVHEVWPGTENSWVEKFGHVAVTGVLSEFDMYHEPTGRHYHCHVYRPWKTSARFCVVFSDITERLLADKTLRDSEMKYRNLFETMKQGVAYHDKNGIISDANPAAEEILGLTLDQMRGRTSIDPRWKTIHQDGTDFPGDTHPAVTAMKTGKVVSGVTMGVYNPAKDDYRWINIKAVPMFHPDENEPYQVYASFEDITMHLKDVKALRDSETRLRSYIDKAPDGMFIADEQGRYLQVNPASCRITGYSAEELTSMSIMDIISASGHEDAGAHFMEVVSKGHASGVFPFIHKSGEQRYWSVDGVKLSDERFMGFVKDVTERRLIDAAQTFLLQYDYVEQKRNFFESLARFLAELLEMDFVCIDRLSGDLLEAETLAVYFDGRFEDNITYTLKDTPCGDVVENTVCCFNRGVRNLFPHDTVLQEMGAEGYLGIVLKSQSGKSIGLIAVISRKPVVRSSAAEKILKLAGIKASGELEQMVMEHSLLIAVQESDILREKAERANQAKDLLLREVHHRIKNNMNTIMGLLLLHSETVDDPSAVAALNDASGRVQSMMLLYDKLYQAGNFKDVPAKEYLSHLVDEILSIFPNKNNISVIKHFGSFILSAEVIFHLGIIINEIITNAMKYAFTGTQDNIISISASMTGNMVSVIIEDNGTGMPDEFDIKRSSGFGLQLVEMLALQLNAVMRFERKKGTKFILEFIAKK